MATFIQLKTNRPSQIILCHDKTWFHETSAGLLIFSRVTSFPDVPSVDNVHHGLFIVVFTKVWWQHWRYSEEEDFLAQTHMTWSIVCTGLEEHVSSLLFLAIKECVELSL